MATYLERLKNLKPQGRALTKLPKPGSVSFGSTPPPRLGKSEPIAIDDETVTAMMLAKACKLTGYTLEQLPEQLRADLLARHDASVESMAFVIRDDAEWFGWDGRSVALADYAPEGRFYRADQ